MPPVCTGSLPPPSLSLSPTLPPSPSPLSFQADKAAGLGAAKRGYVYFTEVKTIPDADLRTVDELWKAYSGGYSIQKGVFNANRRNWQKFFRAIDWVTGEDNNYRAWPTDFKYNTDAKKGHLPLTAALRGTMLHEAIMDHPAFATKKAKLTEGPGTSSVKF